MQHNCVIIRNFFLDYFPSIIAIEKNGNLVKASYHSQILKMLSIFGLSIVLSFIEIPSSSCSFR